MQNKITLPLNGDIQVVLPDSLEQISTYVLQEQGDWFEDEIRFVRALMQPDQQAIDIGANYGMFTLSLAKAVGPNGRVWAIEPASNTAAFLRESVQLNGFEQVNIDQMALSDHVGTARLALNNCAELNELIRDESSSLPSEEVALSTLDHLMTQHSWSDIAFMKMDAEGEEVPIIRGGKEFFQRHSPLVQFELIAGHGINHQLVQTFEEIGYQCYRLIPGLGVIAPLQSLEAREPRQLNLFCCKPDRAATLAARGLLLQKQDMLDEATATTKLAAHLQSGRYAWQQQLTVMPYAQALAPAWQQRPIDEAATQTDDAIALYTLAMDGNISVAERYEALHRSLTLFQALVTRQPGALHAASLARVARDAGQSTLACNAVAGQIDRLNTQRQIDPSVPFLTPCAENQFLDPGAQVGNWIFCSLLEGLERYSGYSSFYSSSQEVLNRLASIRQLGFGSPEMLRRLELMVRRYKVI